MEAANAKNANSFTARLARWWHVILYMGIRADMPARDRQSTLVINVVIISALPMITWFSCINFFHHNNVLGSLNACNILIYIALGWINYLQKHFWLRFPLLWLLGGIFAAEALLFANGAEYFLLMIVLIAVIMFNSKLTYLIFSTVLVALFTCIRIQLTPESHGMFLSHGRVAANLISASLSMVLIAQYFKSLVYNYQVKLEEGNRKLKEANATMQKLFSIVAHDLRSPISALSYSLTLLNDQIISEEEFRSLSSRLSSDVGQLQYNLDNLLRWSITQLQGIEVTPREIVAEEAINHVIGFYQQTLMQKNIQVITQYAPGVRVWADADHFALIMRNLLSNAVKFSYPGSFITITVQASQQQAQIMVQDRGTGMNEQMQQQLFSGAKSNSLSGTRNEKGTGLGLLLCKEFAERNNSTIRVESTPGEGSVFTLCMPLAV
ncbi:Signal transduction histidine kinase [Filimonas lacunae]|uniref:histidine kinase n=1 Tax=Filimonas lacunae TaxID=477680 RepID=A0A173MKN4_9BACT|nr:HAMP domain-containing sensor histidine kinase [Filimonas lacunae]BAV08029.1 two-component sensor histidine kinase [Filimonas lacunae]SIT08242.1 Signal transduction histidine kinase [Filimonas lacunae]